ncbi:hypothetical protein PGB28_08470 [Primorskyibacter aestuariivivens]|uniref:hypothetical protein n=1 Tax=Primorskyibacter aestuariivivens TaxID=1888912 RepID=UPI0023006397|nr:hypothetical protein [Primorskyibacter aestuariivivens]MDA7428492.1 hypothetical protein [Primorskyibacter aestuariivivens]
MRVLIVEANLSLGSLWARHLERFGARVVLTQGQSDAVQALQDQTFEIIVLNLQIGDGAAFAVSDFASFKQPDARVIFVTNSRFFSDGSIFEFSPNACALVPGTTRPEDLAALVEHHAAVGNTASRPCGAS